MRLESVVETSRRVAETPSRLRKIEALADLLGQSAPEEAEIAAAFLSGATRQGRIGIGWSAIRQASVAPADHASLELTETDRALESIRSARGSGRRVELLRELFGRSTEAEQRFLSALLAGELRQGALEGILIEAIARAVHVPADRVRHAVMVAGDAAAVARTLLEKGEAGLGEYGVKLFRPVQPMLAQTAEDVTEALGDLGEASLEYKLDGARVQAHKSGDEVLVFSRALNDVTLSVPEVVDAVRALPARELILDGEVLSLTPEGRPQPFQVTMRRFGRKLEIDRLRQEWPLAPFWFDLLYLDGGSLLGETQRRRFDSLNAVAPSESVIPNLRTSNPVAAVEFLSGALERGHEGVMAKAPDSVYATGARGRSWLKVKQARTLDLVILAAEWGSGRRRGWLSNLHLGARDIEKGGFAMLGKTFKGLTDEMLAWQTRELLKIEIGRDSYTVFVEPKLVAEIAFNEIQVSPRYASGLALRFARVKRYRTDKTAAGSDTFQTVQKLAGLR